LLPNGKVLVAGGHNGKRALWSAELYDPASGTWTVTGRLATDRTRHTATLLPNGKVLVAGGLGSSGYPASAELYNPASGNWTTTGSLATARGEHTATLLPNGKVLVAGGYNGDFNPLASAELYDPASGTWTATGRLAIARYGYTATLLPNGEVLVAGGFNINGWIAGAEVYDSASGTWTVTGRLTTGDFAHTATLLPNGKVLVAGGFNGNSHPGELSRAELYDVGLGFSSEWQPKVRRLKLGGRRLLLAGALFQGISQASGGSTQDSASNYPIVQLRSIDNSQVVFVPVDPVAGWSDTSFTSLALKHFPLGPAMVTIFTNGIPSRANYLVLTDAGTNARPIGESPCHGAIDEVAVYDYAAGTEGQIP
jgi:WD40 repeat protein